MIYLLRHGQTRFNVEERVQGSADSALTDLGREQAASQGRFLRDALEIDSAFEIISSPLGPAWKSAEIMRQAAGLERPVISDARLQEADFGSWERHTWPKICERDPLIGEAPTFLSAWAHFCSDGESMDDAVSRLWGWLRWAGDRNFLVVSHGVAGCILRVLYNGGGKPEMFAASQTPPEVIHRLDMGWIEEITLP